MIPPDDPATRRALVIGGGIGGLATAIALRRVGVEATVFEQAEGPHAGGAGLTLWTNATRVLRMLGLADEVRSVSAPIERGKIRDSSGRLLADVPLHRLRHRLGGPIVGIARAELLATLHSAVDGVRFGARLQSFEQDEGGVTAHFQDGSSAHGDLLVGADGIGSRTRELLLGDPPRYSGYVGWQGVAPCVHPDRAAGVAVWTFGPGAQFGIIPVDDERVYFFGTANVPEADIGRLAPPHEELASRFHGWASPVGDLALSPEVGSAVCTPIYDRPPARRWGDGRITLLGDAAHAVTPTFGQGACLALESALALASRLRRTAPLDESLRGYERERMRRTAPVIRQAWRLGRCVQWQGAVSVACRNAGLRIVPSSVYLRWLERIIGPGCPDRSPGDGGGSSGPRPAARRNDGGDAAP